jgi:integration host factor subunit beta
VNKSDLIEALAADQKMTIATASEIIDTILDSMTSTLVVGDNIEIRGFGSFVVKNYEPYEGRNPKTGVKIAVKPKKLPFFKVGLELKKAVDDGGGKKK